MIRPFGGSRARKPAIRVRLAPEILASEAGRFDPRAAASVQMFVLSIQTDAPETGPDGQQGADVEERPGRHPGARRRGQTIVDQR